MIQFVTSSGAVLDLVPDQDVSITIDNAFFSTEHIDTPWSTDIELALTANNCRVFMCMPAMLFPPQITDVQATCHINGVPVMHGDIKVISYSPTSIKVSFSGRDIDDYLSGYLNEMPLASWNFGSMIDLAEFREFMQKAVDGTMPEFEAPLLLRSDRLDYLEDAKHTIPGPNSDREYTRERMIELREYWNGRYANFINYKQQYAVPAKMDLWERTGVPFLIPVVRLGYLLAQISNLQVGSAEYMGYISKIGILAPNKKNALPDDIYHGGLDHDDKGNYILSLAAGLPKTKVSTFFKDIVNLLAATVYLENGKITIRANRDILLDDEPIDWTDRIAEEFESTLEEGSSYLAGYQDSESASEIKEEDIITVHSYYDIFKMWNEGTYDVSKNYIFQIKRTGDIYSVIFDDTLEGHPEFSLLRRGGIQEEKKAEEDERDVVNAQTNAKLVKCIPATFFYADFFTWYGVYMAAIVDIHESESDPAENITIGILQDKQMVDKGVTIARNWVSLELLITETPVTTPLTLSESDALFNVYHRPYKDFLAKHKTTHTSDLNIKATDLLELKIWKKRILFNQHFFVKSIVISTNTSSDYFHAEATFVRA